MPWYCTPGKDFLGSGGVVQSQASPCRMGVSFFKPNAWLRADPKVLFQMHTVVDLPSPSASVRVEREASNASPADVPAQGNTMSRSVSPNDPG